MSTGVSGRDRLFPAPHRPVGTHPARPAGRLGRQPATHERTSKDHNRLDLAGWWAEAEAERGNDDAGAALIVHKRRGKGNAADQWVTLTLGELVALISGNRDHLEEA